MFVKIRKNESIDHLIQRFKKKVALEGLMDEVRDRSVYRKPSSIKQDQRKMRLRKIKKYKRELYGSR